MYTYINVLHLLLIPYWALAIVLFLAAQQEMEVNVSELLLQLGQQLQLLQQGNDIDVGIWPSPRDPQPVLHAEASLDPIAIQPRREQ